MTAKEQREEFNISTDTLSTQIRHVDYSLIAVVWILSGNAISGLKMDGNGYVLFLVVLSLLLDMSQYIWKSCTSWFHFRKSEREDEQTGKEGKDYSFPLYIPTVTWVFFGGKLLACLAACVLLAIKLIG